MESQTPFKDVSESPGGGNDLSLNTPKSRKNNAKHLSSALALLAKIVIFIIIVSVLSAAFPLEPMTPLWYLKIGEICIDYSISLLFVLALIHLSNHFGSPRLSGSAHRKTFQRWIKGLLIFYALLIPIQIGALGLYWQQTAQANKQIIQKAESELGVLRKRIRETSTEDQLRSALGEGARLLPPLPGSMLEERKKKLLEAVDNRLFALKSSLHDERQQRLRTFFLSTAKGVLGAGMMTFGFARLKRLETLK
jgi:hypothetical protein